MKKPVLLTILDGLGYDDNLKHNAWKLANTPTLDNLIKNYPNIKIKASGKEVGLPKGQIGNSEVGHLNIGAGKIVYTGLSLIKKALNDGVFHKNKAFFQSIKHAKKYNSTIHLMGLLSQGGVHSLEEHLFELLDFLNNQNIKDVTVHVFTDGRDVSPRSAESSLKKLIKKLKKYNFKLGSIQGRLYAMDRDKMFDKTIKSFETIKGNNLQKFSSAIKYLKSQYNHKNLNDEFIEPAINKDTSIKFLKNNDAVIFFNFRPDRARQLSHLIIGSSLYKEKPQNPIKNIQLTTMMKYEGIKSDVAFDSIKVKNPLGKVISENGLKQLRIAETQKYAHVTFFLDGGKDIKLKGSDRILIHSLKVENFETVPNMSAKEITDNLLKVIENYDLIILNYANPDMIGHTGNQTAAIEAMNFLDTQLKRLYQKIKKINGVMFITADHGNIEIMADENNNPVTKHTTSDVPLIITDKSIVLKNLGSLANIAPTILDYMKIKKPISMDHKSLINLKK